MIGSANTYWILIGSANTRQTRVPYCWILGHVHLTSCFSKDVALLSLIIILQSSSFVFVWSVWLCIVLRCWLLLLLFFDEPIREPLIAATSRPSCFDFDLLGKQDSVHSEQSCVSTDCERTATVCKSFVVGQTNKQTVFLKTTKVLLSLSSLALADKTN